MDTDTVHCTSLFTMLTLYLLEDTIFGTESAKSCSFHWSWVDTLYSGTEYTATTANMFYNTCKEEAVMRRDMQ